MNLNIIQWNLKGYYNNYQEIEMICKEFKPQIISLQETHIKHDQTPQPPKQFVGYFHNFPQNTRAKQGCGLLIHKSIPHKVLNIQSNISTVAIEINLVIKFIIFSIYIPPDQQIASNDLNNLINNINSPFILTGDFNAWSPLWGSLNTNLRGSIIEDFILTNNVCLLNDGSNTHFSTHNSFTAIDLSICSPNLFPTTEWRVINDLHNSDHFPILISIKSNNSQNKIPPKPSRFNCKLANWNVYQNHILNDTDKIAPSSNINKETANITKIIRSSANRSIPVTNTRKRKKNVAWWSPKLGQLRDEKQIAWRFYRQNVNVNNLLDFKKKNAIFNKEKKKAKTKSFEKLTEKLSPNLDIGSIWKHVTVLTGTYTPYCLKMIESNNLIITDPQIMTNTFANNFSEQSNPSNFPAEFINNFNNATNLQCNPNPSGKATFLENPFSITEFENTLKTFSGTTPGLDKITYQMLKNAPLNFKSRILKLYNNIFDQGIIPQTFKTALVIPIRKPNKPAEQISSYRPISLLPCLSKTLEKMVSKRIMWFLNTTNSISSNQVGFRSGTSTLDTLLYIDHLICKTLSVSNHISILSVDFEKAFDKIGMHVILNKLIEFKIGPKIFNYVKSFLSNRKIKCRVNNSISYTQPLYNGIPQGSPLSVTLFLIAFEELNKIITPNKKVFHCLYADDLHILCRNKDINFIKNAFNEILTEIDNWSQYSGATISTEKCKHLHVCRKTSCTNTNINYNNYTIENVNNLKILGLIFDCKNSFKTHCLNLRHNLAARLNVIKYLSSNNSLMHTNTLLNIIKQTMQSKIDYGIEIYGKCAPTTLNVIKPPLNTAIRRGLRAHRMTKVENLLAEAGFQKIEDRITYLQCGSLQKLNSNSSQILQYEANLLKSRNSPLTMKSGLCKILELAIKYNLTTLIPTQPKLNKPPWNLQPSSFDSAMTIMKKETTSPEVYQKMFAEIKNKYITNHWEFIYTDGSKQNELSSFAVVNSYGSIITRGILCPNQGIFEAEAQGIISACEYAQNFKKKFVICTDSRSIFEAVQSNNNQKQIVEIQQQLIQQANKLKLMWIPGHSGIHGNEAADLEAKAAIQMPLKTFNAFSKKSLTNYARKCTLKEIKIQWESYSHRYKTLNPNKIKIVLPTTTTTAMNKCFVRVRFGTTNITHQYLFNKTQPPTCQYCNSSTLTIDHILTTCPAIAVQRNKYLKNTPIEVLQYPTIQNITNLYNFLRSIKMEKQI